MTRRLPSTQTLVTEIGERIPRLCRAAYNAVSHY
jgi:hypothetical protein